MVGQLLTLPRWLLTKNTNVVKAIMIKNRLQEIREGRGLSRDKLAELANTSSTQIYRLETGRRKLTDEWKARLAPILHVSLSDLIEIKSTAPIVGYITYTTIGGEAFPFDNSYRLMPEHDSLGDHNNSINRAASTMKQERVYTEVEIPPGVETTRVVALQIKDDPSLPSYFNGWVVGYSQRIDKDIANMTGDICLCKIVNGPTVLRQLKRGLRGHYDLLTLGGGPILENRKIEWCAKILFMRPLS